jgi:hypothetical protein
MICMEKWERSRIAVGFGPFYGMYEKERVESVCFDSITVEKKRRFLRRVEDISSYSRDYSRICLMKTHC